VNLKEFTAWFTGRSATVSSKALASWTDDADVRAYTEAAANATPEAEADAEEAAAEADAEAEEDTVVAWSADEVLAPRDIVDVDS